MNYSIAVCAIAFAFVGFTSSVTAQPAAVPLRKGVSVEMPVTRNAVAVPDADHSDALIVAITRDGKVYLGVNRTTVDALPEKIRQALSGRAEKTVYFKADARVPYNDVVQVLDAAQASGVEELTLLTSQRDSAESGGLAPPKGLKMRLAQPRR
ncbi:MAG TPA: biopolymer transporter ExbD [Bryobacteraceae bacterium]|nr:biopolymer transporter ExbD [Bryobacteraceae bacterium]